MSESLIPPFSGGCLFVFEGDSIRILGHNGSEAVVPLADLEAFLEHLRHHLPPDSQPPGAPPDPLQDEEP